jgi:nitrogen fixation-related uncharacterized protein
MGQVSAIQASTATPTHDDVDVVAEDAGQDMDHAKQADYDNDNTTVVHAGNYKPATTTTATYPTPSTRANKTGNRSLVYKAKDSVRRAYRNVTNRPRLMNGLVLLLGIVLGSSMSHTEPVEISKIVPELTTNARIAAMFSTSSLLLSALILGAALWAWNKGYFEDMEQGVENIVESSKTKAKEFANKARETEASAMQVAGDIAATTKRVPGKVAARAEQVAHDAKVSVEDATSRIGQGMHDAKSRVEQGVQDAKSRVEQGVQDAKSRVEQGAHDASNKAEQVAHDAKTKVKQALHMDETDSEATQASSSTAEPVKNAHNNKTKVGFNRDEDAETKAESYATIAANHQGNVHVTLPPKKLDQAVTVGTGKPVANKI